MGCSSSIPSDPVEAAANKKISEEQKKAEESDQQVKKLLLLGTGASGKSTIFKQVKSIYGGGFTEEQRKTYIQVIHSNVIHSIKTLINETPKVLEDEKKEETTALTGTPQSLKSLCEEILLLSDDEIVDINIGHKISQIWHQSDIQLAWARANEFQINESAKYFFDAMDRVSSAHYIPTEMDLLHSRVATVGVVEDKCTIEENSFIILDVGGQRNERKKWIHCFENVTSVLFVTALSEYNLTLAEDTSTNRMTESINLFEDIINNKFLSKTAMILFLNKKDLFGEKLARFPLSRYFPDYEGDNSEKDAGKWIRKQFERTNRNADRKIYTHITCAVDRNNVKFVFNAVKDIVIRQVLKMSFNVQ